MTGRRTAAGRRKKRKDAEKPLRWIGEDELERSRVYEHVFIPQDDPWPRFTIIYPREPSYLKLTPEQLRASRRSTETFYRALGVTLGTAWIAATILGHHKTCKEKACIRMRRCAGRFAEEDWSTFPGPMYPPCADAAGADRVRPISNALINLVERRMGSIYVDEIKGPREALENIGLTRLPAEAIGMALAQVERRRREVEAKLKDLEADRAARAAAADSGCDFPAVRAKSFSAGAEAGTNVPRQASGDAA